MTARIGILKAHRWIAKTIIRALCMDSLQYLD